jgi:hypothetical protein
MTKTFLVVPHPQRTAVAERFIAAPITCPFAPLPPHHRPSAPLRTFTTQRHDGGGGRHGGAKVVTAAWLSARSLLDLPSAFDGAHLRVGSIDMPVSTFFMFVPRAKCINKFVRNTNRRRTIIADQLHPIGTLVDRWIAVTH